MATWIGPAVPDLPLGARKGAVGTVFALVGVFELVTLGVAEMRAVPLRVAGGALVMQAYPRLPSMGNGWMDWLSARWWAGFSVQSEQIDPPPPVGPGRFLAR